MNECTLVRCLSPQVRLSPLHLCHKGCWHIQVAPWSKTGGLGDVLGSLPAALAARGHRVMVVTPRYGEYAEATNTGVSVLGPMAILIAHVPLICCMAYNGDIKGC
eukprot:GHRR01036303.1.p1 GENE.GHRR01036303.1~~GHRR01036303.1.p1  ORF type:complete len:105 (-),score=8.14 GHRR01036303.1:139-453(-)